MAIAFVSVSGRLSKDAEVKFTPEGKKIVTLSIPVSDGKDKPTTWYGGVLSGLRAENDKFVGLLKKGAGVTIHGKMDFKTYEKNDGTLGFSHSVYISEIDITKYADDGGQAQAQPVVEDDSSIPF